MGKIKNRNVFIFILLPIIFFSIGFIRGQLVSEDIDSLKGEKFIGVVIDLPEERENFTQYRIKIEDFSKYVLVRDYTREKVSYKDEVSVVGRVVEPEDFVTTANRIFPYEQYLLRKKNTKYILVNRAEGDGSVSIKKKTEGLSTYKILFGIKAIFLEKINILFSSSEAGLLSGLLLGVKSALGNSLNDIFIKTALIHIVVLSGYNITIVAESIRRLLSFTRKNVGLVITALFIVLFVIMVGADIPALRAGALAVLIIFAKHLHREYDALILLFLVAGAIILYNPNLLLFDASFHLSFLATIALLLFATPFEKVVKFLPSRFQFREIVSATITVQIFLIPYLFISIGQVSIVGFLANAIVLPLVPITMLLGFLSVVFSFFGNIVATPLVLLTDALLSFIIWIATVLSSFEYSSIFIPEVPTYTIISIYIFVIGLYLSRLRN